MVKPSKTTDVTFTVPVDLLARLEAAYNAHADAQVTCGKRFTAVNNRAVATAGRALAAVYGELAARFTSSFPIWIALNDYGVGLRVMASTHNDQATTLDLLTEGG